MATADELVAGKCLSCGEDGTSLVSVSSGTIHVLCAFLDGYVMRVIDKKIVVEDAKVDESMRVQRCLRFERCWFNIEAVIERDTRLQEAQAAEIAAILPAKPITKVKAKRRIQVAVEVQPRKEIQIKAESARQIERSIERLGKMKMKPELRQRMVEKLLLLK